MFDRIGWGGASGLQAHQVVWWVHGIAALGFVAYLPYSKAVHLLIDSINLAFKDPLAGKRLPAPHPDGDHLGQRDLSDFTWKQLLDFDACTKCGRCHVVCPAAAAGAPLSPRDLILDLRQHADATWSFLAPGHERRPDLTYGDSGAVVAGQVVRADTLWSCTTCLACVETCPVGIEHVPTIVGMRRFLVGQGKLEAGLSTALSELETQGNSFGKSARMRARWTKQLDFKIKDARKTAVDYLWFVGDYASYDEQVQEVTIKVARLLHAAGVDFGILYEGERNSGNDVRRVGEEGLFETLAEHNIDLLERCEFKEIVTTDPHTLNALRNEYPAMGSSYRTLHYTELLVRLIESGALPVTNPVLRRVTYHDPCYLARYNGVTDAPRRLLELLGATLVEMPRHGTNTFCCGAGGGRIWMDDSSLTERPSENRIREAVALDRVSDFVVACPKDLTMYRAAVSATGNEAVLAVRDIVDLVAEAVAVEVPAGESEAAV
jgi:Fe-S oxidoreductase